MSFVRQNILFMICMFMASVTAMALHPTHTIDDVDRIANLEEIIPKNFGNWHAVDSPLVLVKFTDEKKEALTKTVYDQTVMRTYVDENGNAIMLAVAYGARQSSGLNVHRPERCYPAQGFDIGNSKYTTETVQQRSFPVTQLVAKQGQRVEPITYWIRIGHKVVRSSLGVRGALLWAGLGGYIPDGMLVRVSNIITTEQNIEPSYLLQQTFLNEFISALSVEGKKDLLGDLYKP